MRTDGAGVGRRVSRGSRGLGVVFLCVLDLKEQGSRVGNNREPAPCLPATAAAAPRGLRCASSGALLLVSPFL